MRPVILVLLTAIASLAQTQITGTFKTPSGVQITGKVVIELTKPTVTNTCASSVVVTFKPITVQITNGTLGTLSLYPSHCLQPTQTYVAKVYSGSTMVYKGSWTVPDTSPVDVTKLESNP